jgi:translocation and assembly module TamB
VSAPDLTRFAPSLTGRIKGQGALKGPAREPHLRADIEAYRLAIGQQRLAQARAHVDVDLQSEAPWIIDVSGTDIVPRPGFEIKSLSLSGRGNIDDHELVVAASLPQGRFSFHARGRYADSQWQGEISQGKAATEEFGTWSQENGSPVIADTRELDLRSWCWTDGDSRICAEGQWKRTQASSLRVNVEGLSLARLSLLERYPEIAIAGTVRGSANATIDQGRIAALTANAETGPGEIRYRLGDDDHATGYREARIDISGNADNLDAEFRIALQTGDAASGHVRLAGWQENLTRPGEQSLEGHLRFSWRDFGLTPVFVPAVSEFHGTLDGEVGIDGTLATPIFAGSAHLADGAFDLPRYGLAVTDIELSLEAPAASSLVAHGSAVSGGGRVELAARFSIPEPERWKGSINVKGQDFEVVRIPGQHVLVSPDLNVALAPHSIDLSGSLNVPMAEIKLLQREKEVRLSPDVIVVGQGANPTAEPVWRINSHLRVSLGEKVHVQGYGFDGRLAGELMLTEPPEGVALADGEIRVVKGSYAAYGQTLTIEDGGRLFYAGGPLADPGLDLRAVRTTNRIKVGVLVRGRLRAPQLRLYSDTPLSDSDMLSYLVLGRPYSAASAAQGALLYKAASTLGGGESGNLVTNIVQRFGLSDVRVESGATFQDTAVAVEKYLSPRLYLRYAVGLWDGAGSLRIRYKLSDKWTIEGSSGHLGGADILYTRER